MKKNIKILIIEDDLDFCYLIRKILEKQKDFQVVGQCSNASDALSFSKELQPDIVLLDLNLSSNSLDGIEIGKEIRLETDAKIVILTAFEDPDVVLEACTGCFASAYIFKSQFNCPEDTIRNTANGSTPQQHLIQAAILSPLSPAERSVFHMILGESVTLHSSSKTIANQKTSILKKLGLKKTKDLIHIFDCTSLILYPFL